MRKILIISYYFEPCSLTASQRTTFWAKNLSSFGFYPIIITRNWNENISKPNDVLLNKKNEYKLQKTESYEVHSLPFKNNLRDRILLSKKSNYFLKILQKTLTLKDLILIHFSIKINPVDSFYYQTEEIIKKEQINGILISGAPFELFKIGYLINKKFNIPWIADYRDDWNTNEVLRYNNIERILNIFNKYSEQKWIKTSSAITSISKHYTKKISIFNNKIGYTIENGFQEYIDNHHIKSNKFIIVYNGTLYKSQKIEEFMDAFINFSSTKDNVQLKFIGAGFDNEQRIRLEKYIPKLKDKLFITNRVTKKEIINEQRNASILLMFSHTNCKGIPSSKLYEYFSFGKYIMSTPKDNDIIDQKLLEYELGYSFDLKRDIEFFLHDKYNEFTNHTLNFIQFPGKNEFIKSQHRFNQTEKLAQILHTYF